MNHLSVTGVLLCALLACTNLWADKTDRIIQQQKANINSAAQSQRRIDNMSDKTQDLFQDFQMELKRIEDLKLYNLQLQQQIQRQKTSIETTKQSIQDVAIIERQITPLLNRMIQSLETFISLDVPFLLEERSERVAFLKHTLQRTDVSLSEKYRQVMEAYNVEMEYGNTIESYRASLVVDQQTREVEFLRIGRVGLMYQTLDGKELGAWNSRTKSWQQLDGRYRRDIRLGFKIARKQAAPELLSLPMLAPES